MTNILVISKHIPKHFRYLPVKRHFRTNITKFLNSNYDISDKTATNINKIAKPNTTASPKGSHTIPQKPSNNWKPITEVASNETSMKSDTSVILANAGEAVHEECLDVAKSVNHETSAQSNDAVHDTRDSCVQTANVLRKGSSPKPIVEKNFGYTPIFETFWSAPVPETSVRQISSDIDDCEKSPVDACKSEEPEEPRGLDDSDKNEECSVDIPNVTGLSEKVLKVTEPAGPGAGKDLPYKNPEYYSFNKFSFYDAELEMSQDRLPQPSVRVPYFHEPKKCG